MSLLLKLLLSALPVGPELRAPTQTWLLGAAVRMTCGFSKCTAKGTFMSAWKEARGLRVPEARRMDRTPRSFSSVRAMPGDMAQ